MKLYTYPAAPNPRRVHLFLREKGIEMAQQTVDLAKREQFTDDYRALNPLCTVPALLTDEGLVLAQVNAICDYLEAVYPDKPLLGRTPVEKGEIREWCHRIFVEGLMAIAEALRNGVPTFVNRALPGPVDFDQIPALVARGNQRLDLFFQTLDGRLSGRDYVVGDSFSMADIDALVSCDFAKWIKRAIPEECVNIKRWRAAVTSRPAIAG